MRRRNPTPAATRVSITDALRVWPALSEMFARAAAFAVLRIVGYHDDDAEIAKARGSTVALTRLLRASGVPEAKLAIATVLNRTAPKKRAAAVVELAPLALPLYQEDLFFYWDISNDSAGMVALVAAGDVRLGVRIAAQLARTVQATGEVDARAQRAIDVAEEWTCGKATVAQARAAAQQAHNEALVRRALRFGNAALLAASAAASAVTYAESAAHRSAPSVVGRSVKWSIDAAREAGDSIASVATSVAAFVRERAACPELVL